MGKIKGDELKFSAAGYRFLPMRDPEVLETRTGGGCLSVFGLPFLLAGLFVMQIPLGLIPVENAEALPWFFFIPFGGIFAAVGSCLVFGRSGLILDKRRGLVIQWQGLIVPMKRKEQILDNMKRVSIHKDTGDRDSATSYPVKLEGDTVKALTLFSPTDYQEARQAAEELARFLSRPVVDFSSGAKVVRAPDRLDESFQERVHRTKEDTSHLPDPPHNMKTRIQETASGVVLEIPGQGVTLSHWVQFGLVLCFVGGVLHFFVPFLKFPAPPGVRYFFLGFFLIFFVLGPLGAILRHMYKDSKRSTLVTVNRGFLRVEERAGRKNKLTEIPADKLEELELPAIKTITQTIQLPDKYPKYNLPDTGTPRLPDGRPMPRILVSLMKLIKSPGITARSDAAWVQFGSGLSEGELKYLHALIKKILTGQ